MTERTKEAIRNLIEEYDKRTHDALLDKDYELAHSWVFSICRLQEELEMLDR